MFIIHLEHRWNYSEHFRFLKFSDILLTKHLKSIQPPTFTAFPQQRSSTGFQILVFAVRDIIQTIFADFDNHGLDPNRLCNLHLNRLWTKTSHQLKIG